ncbi:MAG: isopentenyl transferase family protein [Vicinamibacterales bacterium]
MNNGPFVAITGPTCSGKTQYITPLAATLDLDIINLDSFQVFKHFRIGTGRADLASPRTRLYGFADPMRPVSPDEYVNLATEVLKRVLDRGGLPVFEGGSIGYLTALEKRVALRLIGVRPYGEREIDQQISARMERYPEDALLEEIREGIRLGYRQSIVLKDEVVYAPYVDYLDGKMDLPAVRRRVHINLRRRHLDQLGQYRSFDVEWLPREVASASIEQRLIAIYGLKRS